MTREGTRREAAKRRLAELDAAAQRDRWRADPVAFAHEALGVQLTRAQKKVLRGLTISRARISWRAAQKVGKSTLKAIAALWRGYCFDRGLAVLVSGSAAQLKDSVWSELTRIAASATIPLPPVPLDPATGLLLGNGGKIVGIAPKTEVQAAGRSSPHILVLLDEASGIDDAIIIAAMTNAFACGGEVMISGNPTTTTGFFARTQREKLPGWQLHHTSALESPNIIEGRTVIPGLADVEFPKTMAENFGEDSPAYLIRVLGEYAAEDAHSVIPYALLEAALRNYDANITPEVTLPLEVGVDPARFGDDSSVIQGKVGYWAYPMARYNKLDNIEVAEKTTAYVADRRAPGQRVIIRVDTGGLGGGVYDNLKRWYSTDTGVDLVSVNSAERPTFPGKFAGTRAQLWWSLRMWFKRGAALSLTEDKPHGLPKDEKQEGELLVARYSTDNHLKIQVETKDEMKKRLTPKRSPDRADALALACFGESPLADGEEIRGPLVATPPNASRNHPVHGKRRDLWGGERPAINRTDTDDERWRKI